jgi:hypothetical protein
MPSLMQKYYSSGGARVLPFAHVNAGFCAGLYAEAAVPREFSAHALLSGRIN